MTSWATFAAAEPEFADRVRGCFSRRKHATLATLRRDGSPRISGTEVEFVGDDVCLGMMPGSVKALDLHRDPRLALHSPTVDPPEEDPGAWPGEAKIAGVAREVPGSGAPGEGHRFTVGLLEVVVTAVGVPADHLVIESWHPGRGLQRRTRR
ncbi:MAG: pyridoxamine 5'-phosphate oxidase [Actinomycetales bacterium]|nr:pyridoxamine 5'-phosphate oxidase [Actinomycetales bacterium]